MKKHRALEWISRNCVFPVTAGRELAHQKVGPHLLPFQKKIIRQVFDYNGNIKKSLFIYGCRKISKTFLFSMMNWFLINDLKRKGFQMPCMASVLPQSLLIWKQLKSQPTGHNRFFIDKIVNKKTGSSLDFMTSSPSASLGLESSGLTADEIGAYRNLDTLLNLSTGGSLSNDNFLNLWASNPPMSDDHPVVDLLKSCDNDPNFVVHRFYLPAGKDWTDEKNWAIANPFIKEFFKTNGKRFAGVMRFYRNYFNRALTSRTEEFAMKRYLLGMYCGSDTEYIPNEKIQVCDESVYKNPYIRWVLGCDYSITHDFTSVSLVGWDKLANKIYTKCFLYLPNTTRRRESQKRQFEEWERMGFLTIQNREVLQGEQVAAEVMIYLAEKGVTPEAVVFDKAISGHHTDLYNDHKVECVRMTPREMTTSIRELERCGADRGLHLIGDNKCLRWMFQNVITSNKSKNYVLMNRTSDRQNIDGPVSITLALKYMVDNPHKKYLLISG